MSHKRITFVKFLNLVSSSQARRQVNWSGPTKLNFAVTYGNFSKWLNRKPVLIIRCSLSNLSRWTDYQSVSQLRAKSIRWRNSLVSWLHLPPLKWITCRRGLEALILRRCRTMRLTNWFSWLGRLRISQRLRLLTWCDLLCWVRRRQIMYLANTGALLLIRALSATSRAQIWKTEMRKWSTTTTWPASNSWPMLTRPLRVEPTCKTTPKDSSWPSFAPAPSSPAIRRQFCTRPYAYSTTCCAFRATRCSSWAMTCSRRSRPSMRCCRIGSSWILRHC